MSRYDELLAGEMCISLINEPIDFEVAPLTALERARRRWSEANVTLGVSAQKFVRREKEPRQ